MICTWVINCKTLMLLRKFLLDEHVCTDKNCKLEENVIILLENIDHLYFVLRPSGTWMMIVSVCKYLYQASCRTLYIFFVLSSYVDFFYATIDSFDDTNIAICSMILLFSGGLLFLAQLKNETSHNSMLPTQVIQ